MNPPAPAGPRRERGEKAAVLLQDISKLNALEVTSRTITAKPAFQFIFSNKISSHVTVGHAPSPGFDWRAPWGAIGAMPPRAPKPPKVTDLERLQKTQQTPTTDKKSV